MLAIRFLNDQIGNLRRANYKYEVVATQTVDGKLQVIKIAEGEIKGHFREDGWEGLVKKFSDQLEEEKHQEILKMFVQLQEEGYHV